MRTQEQLMDLFHEAYDEILDLGIEPGCICDLKISAKMTRSLGQCKRTDTYSVRGDKMYIIKVSSRILADEVSDDFIKSVLVHELIHTVDGCMNHGPNFLREADKVNRKYPQYRIQRLADKDQLKENRVETIRRPLQHQVRCEKCGQTIRRRNKIKLIRMPSLFRCGRCGGAFVPFKELETV